MLATVCTGALEAPHLSPESLLGDSVDHVPVHPQLPVLAPLKDFRVPVVKIAWLKLRQGMPKSFRSCLWVPAVVDVCSVGELALKFQGLGMRGKLRP